MAVSFLQTDEWASFKTKFGWQSVRRNGLLSLIKPLPFGKSLEYFPEIPLSDESLLTIETIKNKPAAGRIFSRFEFFELWSAETARKLVDLGLVKSFEEVQPEYRQWIDLTPSLKELVRQMKPKGRYNLRLALRKKLKVKIGLEPHLVDTLFALYDETARRADFSGRSKSYFQNLAMLLKEKDCGAVISVWHEDKPLSALMMTFYKDIASYLYGGSSARHREMMASYLAHFEAIKLAKQRGCKIYDLLAIAPGEPPNRHPYAGLTRFKQSFGGRRVRLLGSWDLVHERFWYKLYTFVEKRRRKVIL